MRAWGKNTSIPLQPIDVHEDVYDVDAYVPIALFNRVMHMLRIGRIAENKELFMSTRTEASG